MLALNAKSQCKEEDITTRLRYKHTNSGIGIIVETVDMFSTIAKHDSYLTKPSRQFISLSQSREVRRETSLNQYWG
jgi:hypothetical protein